jgi:hypothetical protein
VSHLWKHVIAQHCGPAYGNEEAEVEEEEEEGVDLNGLAIFSKVKEGNQRRDRSCPHYNLKFNGRKPDLQLRRGRTVCHDQVKWRIQFLRLLRFDIIGRERRGKKDGEKTERRRGFITIYKGHSQLCFSIFHHSEYGSRIRNTR